MLWNMPSAGIMCSSQVTLSGYSVSDVPCVCVGVGVCVGVEDLI